jgi:diguanylate cyclase (GGDEF)-like protein/PAS domain S-box-containing protein
MDSPEFKDLLDGLSDGVYFVDVERRITYWNKAAENISGYSADEVLGNCCMDNLLRHVDEDGTSLCLVQCPLAKTIQSGTPHSGNLYLHHKEGHRVPVSVRVSPIRNQQGKIVGAVEIFNDNSTTHAALRRLKALENEVLVDPVTRLPNRRWINIQLQARLQEYERYRWMFGLLFLDIDHFKEFNDTYGHQAGDLILAAVGKTLAGSQRESDFTGRWGGEEFLAIIPHANLEVMHSLANRFRILVATSSIRFEGNLLKVTISVGGTLIQPSDSLDSLLGRVDRLMYQSKNEGRNRVTID